MKRILMSAVVLSIPVEVLAHGNHSPMPDHLHNTYHSMEALIVGGAVLVGMIGAYILLRRRGSDS